ncbi:ephrin-B2a-like isoform X2 [Watersipora subatra]|uniref:ephrin-B2a-like isoform X2 n=1 Tax=Watersipora subatra TaxID=2589382 RepID=UPI00355B7C18
MLFGCFRWTEPAAHTHTTRNMTLLHIMLSIFGTLSLATDGVETAPPLDIYWNKTNSIFSHSNNDHILEVQIRERIRFLCPFYDSEEPQAEHYIIYRLPKHFYDDCYIPSDASESQLRTQYGIEKVHNCSSPYNQSVFISYIDSFIPLPGAYGGLAYNTGTEYYFTSISTGTSSGIRNRRSANSACKNYNMKAIVRVCCNDTFTNPPLFTGPTSTALSNSTVSTTDSTIPSTQPTISWTTLKSVTSSKSPTEKTTASSSLTETQVRDNSSPVTLLSVSTLLLSLICGQIAFGLT